MTISFGKELFIRFTVCIFREHLLVCVCAFFSFWFWGWDARFHCICSWPLPFSLLDMEHGCIIS